MFLQEQVLVHQTVLWLLCLILCTFLKEKKVDKEKIVEVVCRIEIDIPKEPTGKQNQYAVSFGGSNYIKFHRNGKIDVEGIEWNDNKKTVFGNNLMMFYVGNKRAGSGGFLLFYCNPENQNNVRKALKLREFRFEFDNDSSKRIYSD